MRFLLVLITTLLIVTLAAEDSDARKKRRRRVRSKIYSPPSKFQLKDRKASFEIKKNKLILTFDGGRTEETLPFQTQQDSVAGMSYIPLGERHFIQVVMWSLGVKGNLGPNNSLLELKSDEVSQMLYWDLFEVVQNKIIWRKHLLLDQFFGKMDLDLPPHLENAIQLALDEKGKVYFRRGAVEEFIPRD